MNNMNITHKTIKLEDEIVPSIQHNIRQCVTTALFFKITNEVETTAFLNIPLYSKDTKLYDLISTWLFSEPYDGKPTNEEYGRINQLILNPSVTLIETLHRVTKLLYSRKKNYVWRTILKELSLVDIYDNEIFANIDDSYASFKTTQSLRIIYWVKCVRNNYISEPITLDEYNHFNNLVKSRIRYYDDMKQIRLREKYKLSLRKYKILTNAGLQPAGREQRLFNVWHMENFENDITRLYELYKLNYYTHDINDCTKPVLTEFLHNTLCETYGKKLEPDGFKFISYKSMVEDYFKGFTFDYSINAPRLSKQLKAAGFNPSHKEIVYFGEVRKFFKSLIFNSDNDYNTFLYVDITDFEIPDDVDDWAFHNSCNRSISTSGGQTHIVLRELGLSYLKIYSDPINLNQYLVTLNNKVPSVPYARAYYYDTNTDVAHAGMYADYNGVNATTNYEFTTVLLSILFDHKIDDFEEIRGINIDNDDLVDVHWYDLPGDCPHCSHSEDCDCNSPYDCNYVPDCDRYCAFWANMSDDSDYLKLGTAPILYNLTIDDIDVNNIINDLPWSCE